MKYHIAVDADDCIVDFWARVEQCFETEFGISAGTANSWGDTKVKHHFPAAGYDTWWDWLRDRHWLWGDCGVVPGALGGLAELRARGFYVDITTHKPGWARREMTRWLGRFHPGFDRLTIVDPETPKHAASDATLLIDDRIKNVEGWVETNRPAILFDQPWNKKRSFVDAPILVQRAYDWREVVAYATVALEGVT